jgi:hypothetical protein
VVEWVNNLRVLEYVRKEQREDLVDI